MSEAMTNREIEDVLTSIRRLVAQDGVRPTDAGRLILTEELRVGVEAIAAAVAAPADAPKAEGEPVSNAVVSEPQKSSLPEPDFGKLEATIAELEAAVSASGEAWEAEASAVDAPRTSNVTDLYGRLSFVHRSQVPQVADVIPEPLPDRIEPTAILDSVQPESVAPEAVAPEAQSSEPSMDALPEHEAEAFDTDHGAANYIDDESVLDEDMLRALVAQIVREELHGQLGERVTQQVRKLVRAEIAKALDDRSFL